MTSTIPLPGERATAGTLLRDLGGIDLDPAGFFVYCLWAHDGSALYVGQSSNIFSRLRTHVYDPAKRGHIANITIIRCADLNQMELTERWLIAWFNPPLNIALRTDNGRTPLPLVPSPRPERDPKPSGLAEASADEPARYAGLSVVAGWLGYRTTIALVKAIDRSESSPVPDAITEQDGREVRGWLPSRRPEFEAWKASLPGRGKGGGRPPKYR